MREVVCHVYRYICHILIDEVLVIVVITAFSLLGESGMNPLCVELGITDWAATGI